MAKPKYGRKVAKYKHFRKRLFFDIQTAKTMRKLLPRSKYKIVSSVKIHWKNCVWCGKKYLLVKPAIKTCGNTKCKTEWRRTQNRDYMRKYRIMLKSVKKVIPMEDILNTSL